MAQATTLNQRELLSAQPRGESGPAAISIDGVSKTYPVPLDDPRDAPPPDELKDLHFNDLMLLCIKAEEARQPPKQV